MEDRLFDLMSKIYGELSEFRKETREEIGTLKSDVSSLKFDVSSLKSEVSSLKSDVNSLKKDVIGLENKMENGFGALFDGYKQTYEKAIDIEDVVRDLVTKVEKQEVEIKVIRGGK